MMKWSRMLAAGAVLVLLTNAFILIGVAYNRSEDPESLLLLSRRELQHSRGIQENSGITLSLNWRIAQNTDSGRGYPAGKWGSPAWLDKAKLSELGFDADDLQRMEEKGLYASSIQSREALLVLELNGAAWQQELQRAREYAEQSSALQARNPDSEEFKRRAKVAEQNYEQEEKNNSRLFVIDAGTDLPKLRAAYPDRARYAIVHGYIRPGISQVTNETRIAGYISELSAEHIGVPFDYRQAIESTAPYEIRVAFGRRLEPWIVGVGASEK